jgi:hypothetical protein
MAHAGDAQGSRTLVADQPQREADQGRRQGSQPRPFRHVPAGRGRGIAANAQGDPDADRPAAGAARSSMKRFWGSKCGDHDGEVRVDECK